MVSSPVQTLLGAVQRRLWRGQFVAAVRLAMWGSAGLLLLAVAVHLAARAVPAGALLSALAVLWASLIAWAASRRPAHSACALWIDRHLEGASAYTTLLDVRQGAQGTANAQAVRWLEHWATAKVPDGLRLLDERHESARLSRPLLSMLVCTALAAFVLAQPNPAPSPRQRAAASSAPDIGDHPMPVAETPASAQLVSDVANALRSAASPAESERGEAGRAPAAGPGKTGSGTGSTMAQAGTVPAGERPAVGESLAGTPVDAAPAAAGTQAAGAGSGRDAGDSHDERADVGVSPVLRGTIAVQRSESRVLVPSTERRADMDQSATYDEEFSMHGAATMGAGPAAAAATPPPATESTRLTPTETSYVQAWMKANARRR